MNIKRGQIFLWNGDTPFISNAIKRLTNSTWSHTGWIYDEKHVLEAEWNGVVVNKIGYYEKHFGDRFITMDLPLEMDLIEKCMQKASSYIGKAGYDYKLISSLGWALFRGKRCHAEIRDWNGAFICSELVAKPIWEEAKFRFIPDKFDIEATVPGDIWNKLHKSKLEEELKNADADQLISKMNEVKKDGKSS